MKTEELIGTLSATTLKTGPYPAARRLAIGLAAGLAGAALFLLAFNGYEADFSFARHPTPFLTKIIYSTSVGLAALLVAANLLSPERRPTRMQLTAFAPVGMMMMLAMAELFMSPPETWLDLMFGYGVSSCVATILMLSVPIFAGLFWSFRKFAPTHPQTTGASIGGLAGASAAALYALTSGDASTCFVFIWYTMTIGMTTFAGIVLGSRLLRW